MYYVLGTYQETYETSTEVRIHYEISTESIRCPLYLDVITLFSRYFILFSINLISGAIIEFWSSLLKVEGVEVSLCYFSDNSFMLYH